MSVDKIAYTRALKEICHDRDGELMLGLSVEDINVVCVHQLNTLGSTHSLPPDDSSTNHVVICETVSETKALLAGEWV